MRIEFGIWDHFERRASVPVADQYHQKIELLRAAEQLGFYGYLVAEHHLSPLDLAPSPSIFLAALAQATRTLRVGSLVHVLPLYHPVRLVQELCMLDQISRGRLDVGIGRGVRSVEHEWFGFSPEESRRRNDEIRAILVGAMTTGIIGGSGPYYEIPEAPLDVLPVQRPYPPFWYAGGTDFAGRHGLNFVTRSVDEVARYWTLVAEHADSPERLNPHVAEPLAGITRHMVIRPTDAEAIAVARRAWPVYQRNFEATSLRMPNGQVARARVDEFDAVLAENRNLLVGSPETVSHTLHEWVGRLEGAPSFYFAPAVQWGDITSAEALTSLNLFATDVMPTLRPDPVGLGR